MSFSFNYHVDTTKITLILKNYNKICSHINQVGSFFFYINKMFLKNVNKHSKPVGEKFVQKFLHKS